MENLYRILNVAPTASAEEIKKAISRELRIWTNRTNAPLLERRQEAERMVKLLQDAETKLLDANKRAEYDRQLATESIKPIEQPSFEKIHQGNGLNLFAEAQDLLLKGKVADALLIATYAVQQDSSSPENWALRGLINFEWSEIENAISDFQQAISLRPNVAFYYFELGNVYESIEQWDQALLQYQRAAKIEPQTIMYQAAIGWLYIVLGQYQHGIRILEQCVQVEPQNNVYQGFLAYAYVAWADSDEYLTFVPPENSIIPSGYYATTKQQVQEARAVAEKAESLKVDDAELTNIIMQTKKDILRRERRKFHGNVFLIVVNVAWGLLVMLISRGSEGAGWYWLICSGLYIASCMTPQYVINRKAIKGKGQTSEGTLATIATFLLDGRGMPGCFVIVIFLYFCTTIFLPVLIVWNFMRNYVLVH